ncbi:hypothetical protein C8Q70DRAFT_1007929 [Cubamyces menziesii]|nr:hypothetical protein C8Q70DRAFT_1007929 [Cubamyces menziesii]
MPAFVAPVSIPTVRVLTRPELEALLVRLRQSFEDLPKTLPDNMLDFRGFSLSPDECEDRGGGGALNHLLECTLCRSRLHLQKLHRAGKRFEYGIPPLRSGCSSMWIGRCHDAHRATATPRIHIIV